MMFTDRYFLSLYSKETMAASLPGGLTTFLFLCTFTGALSYVTAMVAQRRGSGAIGECGPVAWQGIYLSFIGALALLPFIPAGEAIFKLAGHSDVLVPLETAYFRILMSGALLPLLGTTLSSYFSGLGENRIVMLANCLGMLLNIPLDIICIYGLPQWDIPAMGIAGAAWATVGSAGLTAAILLRRFLSPSQEQYNVWRFAFNRALFTLLAKFGLPSGLQFLSGVGAFNLFILLLGSLGVDTQTAVNITLSWDLIAFLPQLGIGVAVSAVVGKCVGAGDHASAMRVPYISMWISFTYAGLMSLLFLCIPEFLVRVFGGASGGGDYSASHEIAVVMLRVTAAYVIFDAITAIFGSALRGAGDTRFQMIVSSILSWLLLALPAYVLIVHLGVGPIGSWVYFIGYLAVIAAIFVARFQSRRWIGLDVLGKSKG